MLYAAATLWLMLIVLLAWGVHHLWSGLVKPKVVNAVLLPGTLVAQLGHVLGLLVTGGTVNNTALMSDDDSGAPEMDADAKPRVPLIGPIVVALLPMIALGAAIYASVQQVGGPLMARLPPELLVSKIPPQTLAAFWDQLRALITLAEVTLESVRQTDLANWRNALFVYLLVCMSVRMAPIPGNLRGHLAAVCVTGIVAALLGTLAPSIPSALEQSWQVVTLTVATLVLLLVASLLIRAGVGLIRIVAGNE